MMLSSNSLFIDESRLKLIGAQYIFAKPPDDVNWPLYGIVGILNDPHWRQNNHSCGMVDNNNGPSCGLVGD